MKVSQLCFFFFFFNDTATTEIYTLSLHDALPISGMRSLPHPDWITPDWPAGSRVHALITTRDGGVSSGKFASLNLSMRVGDDPRRVARNRAILRACLPAEPAWVKQVHGTAVIDAARATPDA